jgi:hypothetical protein
MKTEIGTHFHEHGYREFYKTYFPSLPPCKNAKVLCPFHDDHDPSLSINLSTGQFFCHGCKEGGDIFAFYGKKHGLNLNGDFPKILEGIAREFGIPVYPKNNQRDLEAVYSYVDEKGHLLFQVCRFAGKDFRQRRPDGKGGWIWNLEGVRRIPYRLPELLEAEEVLFVEGEKDVENLRKLGFTATTTPGGSKSWRDDYAAYFKGKDMVLTPDNDNPGRDYILKAGKAISGIARSVKYLELPDLRPGEDISDWIKKEDPATVEERLSIMIENAPPFGPEQFEKPFPTAALIITDLKSEIQRNKERGTLGIDPGFSFLRKAIRALIPSHLWVIGGYTSHGKSAFAVELIWRVFQGTPSAKITLFSLEMNSQAYILRLASRCTGIPSLSILQGDHIPEVQRKIDEAFKIVNQKNLIVYDDIYEYEVISDRAKKIKDRCGLDILVIDFIQNIWGKGSIYERMSIVSPKIQALAKELDCTVIALSQVSNEAVNENIKTIGYKGAGEIAAAADIGIWLERDKKDDEILMVGIRKNRHGPLGKAKFRFVDSFTRLKEEV